MMEWGGRRKKRVRIRNTKGALTKQGTRRQLRYIENKCAHRVQESADECGRAWRSTGRCRRCWKAAENCKYCNFVGQEESKHITMLKVPHIRPCIHFKGIHFKGCGMAGGQWWLCHWWKGF